MSVWPVAGREAVVPTGGRAFGAARPDGRLHAGVDLFAREGDMVVAPEAGTVVATQGWAGPDAGALLLQTDRGPVVLFGALKPNTMADVGTRVGAGDFLGFVGRYPRGSQMVHLELYKRGTRRNHRWYADTRPPPELVDPTGYVRSLAEGTVPRGRGPVLPLIAAGVATYIAWKWIG